MAEERFDPDLLDEQDPFEIDAQAAHLCKHPHLRIADIEDVWSSDPLFYPAKPPEHWLMCAEVSGRVLVVPLAPSRTGDPHRRRPDRLLPGRTRTDYPRPEGPMTKKKPMTPQQEYDYYADPDNQQPQGPPRRRLSRLSEMVPVRFPTELLDEIRRRAKVDDRSLSSWIRRAAEHELSNSA